MVVERAKSVDTAASAAVAISVIPSSGTSTLANLSSTLAPLTLGEPVQAATRRSVALTCVDPGCTGERPATATIPHDIQHEAVIPAEAKRRDAVLPSG